MNDAFVADASVGIAWAVQSQSSLETDRLLEDIEAARPFVVPALWALEVANSLLMQKNRRRITADEHLNARQMLQGLAPEVDVEGSALALNRVSDLAESQSLTVYDAIYLELAIRRGLPLATRDGKLKHAAARCHLKSLL